MIKNPSYKLLFSFNQRIFKRILWYLKPEVKDRILDIGCNRGFYVKAMEEYAKDALGVDLDDVSVKNAVTGRVFWGDALDLNFENNYFDKAYSLHLVEHIEDTKSFLSESARVLKPGGKFLLAYPFELFRGMQVIPFATIRRKNPFLIRKIHIHNFNPNKIKNIVSGTPFSYIKSELFFTVFPPSCQYFTLLEKK
ncbi:MAG: class I SAM-dependent methyltransferase [Candidatus Nealsonbacteria bacterium]|nr:class I SAM-dependent methyltransferase [Candidatus Nealsonbacteria bacterium]